MTEVTTAPRLDPCFLESEGGRKEKGESILLLLKEEEKVAL